jgi:hypothetical protein
VSVIALQRAGWPGPAPAARVHADRERYQRWLLDHVTRSVRYNRMRVYDAFTRQWPSLEEWFRAPLAERVTDPQPYGVLGHSSARILMPYLSYLSLVEGTGLDYERTSSSCQTPPARWVRRSRTFGRTRQPS